MNIYEELINGIAAIGMDIQTLQNFSDDLGTTKEEILERMKTNQHKVYLATRMLAESMKAIDSVINEVYPTAYWHRFDAQMQNLKP